MKLTGKSFLKENFKVLEADTTINMEVIDCMLKGEGEYNVPIYIIRNYLTKKHFSQVKVKFYDIIKKTSGGNRQENFVKVFQIGSTQFQKNLEEYFEECIVCKENVNNLLHAIDDTKVRENFMLENTFKKYFSSKQTTFKPSSHNGTSCNKFTARHWNNDGDLLLLAHEDLTQLSELKDLNEMGNVNTVIASNVCIENSFDSKLLLWNISPNVAEKKKLNLETLGYPYPLDILEGIDCLSLSTKPGDIYFINANFIHAVTKEKNNKRISVGRFMGYSAPNKVIYWT